MKPVHSFIIILTVVFIASFFLGCGASKTVQRVEPDTTIDLSGDWNDTDSRLVSQEMINDVLSRGWLGEFKGEKKRSPGKSVV